MTGSRSSPNPGRRVVERPTEEGVSYQEAGDRRPGGFLSEDQRWRPYQQGEQWWEGEC